MKQTTGEFLATLRKANGYTQQDVADKLGVSNRTLSSWETDRTAPDLLILPSIADLYGVTVDELLRGERRTPTDAALSEDAVRQLRKSRFARYDVRRMMSTGFALLGSLIFLAGCAVMLYSAAPLWLSVILLVLGGGGLAACVILIVGLAYSAVRAEGIVLGEDYTEDNKRYALCVRHGAAKSLLWLSLAHISGAIVILIVFFAAGYYNYMYVQPSFSGRRDYTTPTVALICINAAFAAALFLGGIIANATGISRLGDDGQRAAAKFNERLSSKVIGFGAIPVGIALALMITFCSVEPRVVGEVYFETQSPDEVYAFFQTLNIKSFTCPAVPYAGGESYVGDEPDRVLNIPDGAYFLNFQSTKFFWLTEMDDAANPHCFYDLGNGFYGYQPNNVGWNVLHLYDGVGEEDIEEFEYYGNYMGEVYYFAQEIEFGVPRVPSVVNIARQPYGIGPEQSNVVGMHVSTYTGLEYEEDGGVYRYKEVHNLDLSGTFAVADCMVTGMTAVIGVAVYLAKKKKIQYAF